MHDVSLTDDRRAELFRRFSLDALIYADETSWHLNFVPGQPYSALEASAPELDVLLEQVAAQLARLPAVSGFAARLVFPGACEIRVFHDAVQFLLSAMPQPPERPLLFAAEQGGSLFELQLLVQGEGA